MGETKEGEAGAGEKPKPPVDHGPELARAHQRLDELEKRKQHEHSAEHADHKHDVEPAGDKTTIGRRPQGKGKEGESSSSSSTSSSPTPSAGASIIGCSGVLVAVVALVLAGVAVLLW